MCNERIVIAGGSGFLGSALAEHLSRQGREVVILTWSPRANVEPIRHVKWDGKALGAWKECLEGAEAIVNLTGKNVSCRYTPENRREIDESRVASVKVLHEAIQQCTRPPRAWVQGGSLAIYGDAGERVCDESAPPGTGFPVETCLLWEGAFNACSTPATRKVQFRIGFALGRSGGALVTLAKLTRWFLGGRVGSGRQYISWVHLADLNRMFDWAIERDDMVGVFNATGPRPVTNAEFMRELRRALGRPWSPPAPAWAVRMGALLMGTEACLALAGRRCLPGRLLEKGFEFEYTDLTAALRDLYA